ncbi:HAD family phosphatase [Salinisphaera sp. Q1T1-3]|uniref:HAD family hydrolase n=1 Tax=Salinisphaera sp. Q1T1-3 TaxID=2321229 RepID=UPI000E707F2E|nr:HAD-IB family hydrolase [Salinisphaera sp. Q1T1-3]RJS94051.1 HAD-IB family hydrolase [Salinisphaera sp. Q1T1-3]
MAFHPRIVVFDLDVTLTEYDTFLPFLFGYLRHYRRRRSLKLYRLPINLLKFWRWGDRTWLKTEMLRAFLGGEPRHRIDGWVAEFVEELMDEAMREQGLAQLRAYQRDGVRVILASASFDIYVRAIADALNIDEVLATRAAWDHRDRLVGMDGENCRDDEKLRRVKGLADMPADGSRVAAYSDSHADLPLLRWAEHGVAVCPSKRLFHQVGGLGLEVARW